MDFIDIGTTPYDEDCTQVSRDRDYLPLGNGAVSESGKEARHPRPRHRGHWNVAERGRTWPNVHGVPADAIERMRARWEPVDHPFTTEQQENKDE